MSDNQRRCTCGHTYYDEQGHERFFRFCPRHDAGDDPDDDGLCRATPGALGCAPCRTGERTDMSTLANERCSLHRDQELCENGVCHQCKSECNHGPAPSSALTPELVTKCRAELCEHGSDESMRCACNECMENLLRVASEAIRVQALREAAIPLGGLRLFLADVRAEVERAEARWPDNDVLHRLAALSGEVGELAEGFLKRRPGRALRTEAIQVAACAYRAAKAIESEAQP